MNDIEDKWVYIRDNVFDEVYSRIGRVNNGVVRRIIRKATPITKNEAATLVVNFDDRNFYLLCQSRKAVLHMRTNFKEHGYTFMCYEVLTSADQIPSVEE